MHARNPQHRNATAKLSCNSELRFSFDWLLTWQEFVIDHAVKYWAEQNQSQIILYT